MEVIELRKFGNSTGVILSKEILTKMKAKEGDSLYLIEIENGYKLMKYNPEFIQQMNVAQDIMKSHRDTLEFLANS